MRPGRKHLTSLYHTGSRKLIPGIEMVVMAKENENVVPYEDRGAQREIKKLQMEAN